MNANTETIWKIVTFAVWASAGCLILVVFAIWDSTFNLFDLYDIIVFVAISFTIPFVLCKFFDKLMRQSSHVVKGIASSLGVLVLGSTLIIIGIDIVRPFDSILVYMVSWILVIVAYYGLQASEVWLSKRSIESHIVATDFSFIEFGSDAFCEKTNVSPKAAALVAELHRRANSLMDRAVDVLMIIVVILIFTALFIIFAAKVAKLGIVPVDHLSNTVEEREELIDEQAHLTDQLLDLAYDLSRSARSVNNGVNTSNQQNDYKVTIAVIENRIDFLNESVENLDDAILEFRKDLLADQSNFGIGEATENIFTKLTVTTGITRFGVSIIAVYLVQILLNLYRYNTQTAAHYRALADFLILVDPSDYGKIKSLLGTLLPDTGFKKTPKIVPKKITDAITAGLDRFVLPFRRSAGDEPRKTDKSSQPGKIED